MEMEMKKVLVISDKAFHEGFRLLESPQFHITTLDKNSVWNCTKLLPRLMISRRYSVIHYFWARTGSLTVLLQLIMGKKVILHFIGTDVSQTLVSRRKIWVTRLWQCLGARVVADFDELTTELEGQGIKAETVAFMNREVRDLEKPFPESFSVLSYVPVGKEAFYGLPAILECAARMPDVKFYIVSNSTSFNLPNVISLGRVPDIIDEINRHHVLIRLTRHDGMAIGVVEALSCARYVVWSKHFPHCEYAVDADGLYQALCNLREVKRPNSAGKSYVLERFAPSTIREAIWGIWLGNIATSPVINKEEGS